MIMIITVSPDKFSKTKIEKSRKGRYNKSG